MILHLCRLRTFLFCAALLGAALTSQAQDQVTLVTNQKLYTTLEDITVKVSNDRDRDIVTFDEKSYCSNFFLERATLTGWEQIAPCPLERPTLPTVIKAHQEYQETLPVEAFLSGAREPGLYRIHFEYYVADDHGAPIGDLFSVFSELFQITDKVILAGKIDLLGVVNSVQPITFTFRPADGSEAFKRTVILTGSGEFIQPGIPVGKYQVAMKGSKWLQNVVPVDLRFGSDLDLKARLIPGDINDDNTVDIVDLGLLADAFNSTPSSPNWNEDADLNCDVKVNILDLGLLADNFGKTGDP